MNHEEKQLFKKLKQDIELSLYSRIIEETMMQMEDFNNLPAKNRLEITILISKIRKLENKYIA